ncbi:MAG: hypothetical protein WD100_05170 [Tistlia sp.]|uniref:hypothetical protein n=1 Tax=Tistlia sp. TaxID=3057121 RepID=UPI0034A21300
MALPRELVDVMQLTGSMAGQDAADGEGSAGRLAAAAALVGDFASESAATGLDRLLTLCEEGGEPSAAVELAAETCDRAALLEAEVRRFLETARQL